MPRVDHQYSPIELADYAKLASLAYLPGGLVEKNQSQLLPRRWAYMGSVSHGGLSQMGEALSWSASSAPTTDSTAASRAAVKRHFTQESYVAHIFYHARERRVVVSFCGTRLTNTSDLANDLLIATGKGVLVPQEFLADIQKIFADSERYHPDATLTLVGHSLGGYLATKVFGALDDEDIENHDAIVIGFDSPGLEEGGFHRIKSRAVDYSQRLHMVAINPNFINALHVKRGRVLRVMNDTYDPKKTSTASLFPGAGEATKEAGGWVRSNVAAPLVALAVNQFAPFKVTGDQLLAFEEDAKKAIGRLTGNSPEALREKLTFTLEVHAIVNFVGMLHSDNTTLHEVAPAKWPNLDTLRDKPVDQWPGLVPKPSALTRGAQAAAGGVAVAAETAAAGAAAAAGMGASALGAAVAGVSNVLGWGATLFTADRPDDAASEATSAAPTDSTEYHDAASGSDVPAAGAR